MRTTKFIRIFTVMLVLIAMISTMSITAFADDTVTIDSDWLEKNITAANDSGVTGTQTWMRGMFTTDPTKSDSTAPIGTVNGRALYLTKGNTEADLAKKIEQSKNASKTQEKVSDITDGLNIEADTYAATALLGGFTPILELVLGVLVTLITLGMTLYSTFDIAFLAFPVFRNKCNDAKATGGAGGGLSGAMVKKGSNGEASLRFVTDDAQYAVQQGSVESGRSPWGIYFKRRVMSYILLAICLFILLTGNISLITNIALKIVSGIMNVLTGLS